MNDAVNGTNRINARRRIRVTGAVLVLAALVGVYGLVQFIQGERARELRQWESRMAIVADSRQADIERWIARQTDELRAIADNTAVKLYVTVAQEAGLGSASGDGEGDSDRDATGAQDTPRDPFSLSDEDLELGDAGLSGAGQGELAYLGNLITTIADRAGFKGPIEGPAVNANVERVGVAGIGLLDRAGRVLVASPGFPPMDGTLTQFVEATAPGSHAISNVFSNARGNPAMAFLVPVYDLQSDGGGAEQTAWVLGVKEVNDTLYPRLRHPGTTHETAEAILVRREGEAIHYLSPLRDGTPGLKKRLSVSRPELASAWAVDSPGGFAVQRDYADNPVLAIARVIGDTGWTLVYKIDRAEALAESESRLTSLMIVFAMILVLGLIAMVAFWYYGASQRASDAAHRFKDLAGRFENQRDFMHLVTDSQPNVIVIFDAEGHYRWFNKRMLELVGMERSDLMGKHLSAVLGPREGRRMQGWVQDVLESGTAMTLTHVMEIDQSGPRIYRSDFIPMPTIATPEDERVSGNPDNGGGLDDGAGVLVVAQDITESVREREHRERVMRQLVDTLVSVVDKRDPYSANHSVRVAWIARAIAKELDLDRDLEETVSIAASIMNLGKITVPKENLTKRGPLEEDEIKLVQDAVLSGAELVANVEFDGPVYETLRELQENFDGTGIPLGLKGEMISITARIAAVANAFVGMVSNRAWREGLSFDEAIETLLNDSNQKFDRRIVVALVNYLDNRGGRKECANFGRSDEIENTSDSD